ncbi:MAG: hypothetical protein ACR2GR_11670 [Rhodothermales bacterium]
MAQTLTGGWMMALAPKHSLEGPTPEEQAEKADHLFTDREDFIGAFDRALADLDAEKHHVLVYYGVGGIGKTALRRHLGRRLDRANGDTYWAVVDFKAPRNRAPEQALFLARNELRRKHKFRFPTFDLAYAVYWERTNPQTTLAKAAIPGLEEGDLLNDVILAVEDVPGLGLLTKVPKAIAKIGGRALEWWRTYGEKSLRGLGSLGRSDIHSSQIIVEAR